MTSETVEQWLAAARQLSEPENIVARTEVGDYVLSTVLRPEVFLSGRLGLEAAKDPYETALIEGGRKFLRFWRWGNVDEAKRGHTRLVEELTVDKPEPGPGADHLGA